MPNSTSLQIPDIDETSREQKYRHSLQPISSSSTPSPLRHTKSQNYENRDRKKKKKIIPPPIPELDSPEEENAAASVKIPIETSNDNVKIQIGDPNKQGKSSRRTSKASSKSGVVNAGFEMDSMKRFPSSTSLGNSSVRSSTRDPSVQSLSVVREQYCCCSKYRPRERIMCATIGVLCFIIVILVIVVALVASNGSKTIPQSLFKKIVEQMQN